LITVAFSDCLFNMILDETISIRYFQEDWVVLDDLTRRMVFSLFVPWMGNVETRSFAITDRRVGDHATARTIEPCGIIQVIYSKQ